MSADNPFAVSSGSSGDRSRPDRDAVAAEVSVRTLDMLNQTRPWVRLMGVLLWIGTVLMALGSVAVLIGGLVSGEVEMLIIAPIYLVFVVVYGAMAKSLTGYASRINALSITLSIRDLEDALESQKNFWRLVGIITLVILVLYALILIFAVAGVAFLPMMMGR